MTVLTMKFRGNIGIKAGALFLAVLLWAHVATEKYYEVTVSLPIVVQLPEHIALSSPVPEAAQVKLWGRGKHLLLLRYSGIKLSVRANPGGPGKVSHVLSPMDVDIPEGLDVRALEVLQPSVMEFRVDRRIVRKVPVLPALKLSPAPGHIVLSPKVHPDSVTISGPREVVRKVRVLYTDSLRASALRRSLRRELGVAIPSPYIVCTPPAVWVEVDVQPIVESWLEGIPVRLVYAPKGAWVVPNRVDIEVRGPADVLAKLSPEDVQAYIDYRNVREGKPPEPSFYLPPGVQFLRARPSSFRVQLP